MALKKIYTFQNCASVIEDILDPANGEVEGRCFVIIDNDSGEIWRYPMPLPIAKTQGSKLLGLGDVEIADAGALSNLIEVPGKR